MECYIRHADLLLLSRGTALETYFDRSDAEDRHQKILPPAAPFPLNVTKADLMRCKGNMDWTGEGLLNRWGDLKRSFGNVMLPAFAQHKPDPNGGGSGKQVWDSIAQVIKALWEHREEETFKRKGREWVRSCFVLELVPLRCSSVRV